MSAGKDKGFEQFKFVEKPQILYQIKCFNWQ